jgi:hypothetical protein
MAWKREGMGTPYQRMYDPAKVETIMGTVEAVETVAPMKGMHRAVSLMVKRIEVNIS